MISRSLQRLASADVLAGVLVIVALGVFSYGVSASLRDAEAGYIFGTCLAAAATGFGLRKTRINGIQASAEIVALGILVVWILGAHLTQPLLGLGSSVLSLLPQIIPALRYGIPFDTTTIVESWTTIADASISLAIRFQTWMAGFDRNVTNNDALIRNLVWILALWLCSAWMGWFTERRKAMPSFLPSLAVLTAVTSYSDYKIETVWTMVILLLVLMGIWNYKNHTQQWEKSRIDYSDSVLFDNSQAVLLLTIVIGALAFLTPSVSWQDVVDFLQREQSNETAEMLGIQEPPASGESSNHLTPSLPRDHLLSGGFANSEKIVMMIRTGELPPSVSQLFTVAIPRYYWRSTVYDHYVGGGWVTSTVTTQDIPVNTPLLPGWLNEYRLRHLKVEMIEPEGRLFWSGILFSVDIPFTASWRVRPPSDLFAEQSALLQADIFAASSNVTSYEAEVYLPTQTIRELRLASRDYPEEIRGRYLALPEELPNRVRALAHEITDGLSSPYDKAKAIELYLRTHYSYDLEIPPPPDGRDVTDYFLFDLQKGYCDYFATSMVVLARSVGIPARFVSGYAPGSYDAQNAVYIVRELDAHSWVEVYFPDIGWIEFEPTASQAEIERAEDLVSKPDDKGNETVSQLLARLRLEKIILWLSPALGILIFAIIYFTAIERWLYLRFSPETTIDRIYQKFYLAGRSLAGEWTRAETSSEFLQKLIRRADTIRSGSRYVKIVDELGKNAIKLTDLYHLTLFVDYQVNRKEAKIAWNIWIRLRRQLYLIRFLLFVGEDNIKLINLLRHDQS